LIGFNRYGPYIPSSQPGEDGVGGAFCPVQTSSANHDDVREHCIALYRVVVP